MGRKRKSIEVDVTPSPRRVTRSSTKHGAGDASPKPQDDTESTRLGANVDSLASSDDEEVFSKYKKTKATYATETVRKRVSKGKDTMFQGSPSWFTDEKDLRKKGSAKKLMLINASLDDNQIRRIRDVGFGGLLKIKYSSVHEKLSSWLVRILDTKKLELVIPFRGSIKVNAHAVHRVFGIPMGTKCIEYKKNSGGVSFFEFYKLLGRENTQKAPTFKEAKEMLLVDYKDKFDDSWLQIWLLFAVSSLLCPTSSPNLCVRGFHAMFKVEEIKGYNWCQLVVDRLVKGVQDFKSGKKFLSGCLFFLTIMYLDSLDIPNFVDEKVEPRVSVWTEDKVVQAISLDKLSDNDFGKLRLKAECASMSNTVLIQPERIEEFVNANFTPPSITVSKDLFKQAISDMSTSINQAVFTFCSKLCQIPCNANTTADTGISQQAAAGTSENAAATIGLSVLAAAANTTLTAETQQVHAVAANTTLAAETQQVRADADNTIPPATTDADNTIPPATTQHVVGATGATEPAVNTTIQATTPNVPVSNTTRGSTELLETDEHSYSGQQQEVTKVCSTEHRSGSAGGSTEILENLDDSYSGQLKEESRNFCEGKQSVCEQVQREKCTPLNGVNAAGSPEEIRNNCEINNEYRDLSPLAGSEKQTIYSPPSLHELLESPSKEHYPHYHLEEHVILESPLQPKAKRMLDDIVDAEFHKACHNSSLELILPSKETLERDLLGSLFSTSASVSHEPSHRKRHVVAKRSASNVYTRKVKFNPPQQVAPEIINSSDKATCNAPSSSRAQYGAQIVKNLTTSDAFKAAPDAPSFDLGIDSPTKSQGSITDSMLIRAYDEAMMKSKQQESIPNKRKCTVYKIDTSHVSAEEKDSYNLVFKCKGKSIKGVSSPVIFQSKQVSATSMELANSIAMGKCLSTIAIHVGTSVLSEDATQARKLIMSPWVSKYMLDSTKERRKFVEKAFDFLNTEYDLIFFPILESYDSQASGHWFTFVINLKDSKFHVIDSLRPKTDAGLLGTVNKVIVSVINLWEKVTSKHECCSLNTIFKFKVDYVEGYRQFGIHDCGLFTLKAIEYFDGERIPEVIHSSELHLRMQILYQWLTSPANEIDWKTVLLKQKGTKSKVPDKTSNSLIENPLFFSEPSVSVKKAKHRLPENLLD